MHALATLLLVNLGHDTRNVEEQDARYASPVMPAFHHSPQLTAEFSTIPSEFMARSGATRLSEVNFDPSITSDAKPY